MLVMSCFSLLWSNFIKVTSLQGHSISKVLSEWVMTSWSPACRLLPSVMCYLYLPHLSSAQGGRGEPSPWTGWNPKEQFSRQLKENLCNKTRRARRWTRKGREGSFSTGSPPPPSPPPSQSPTRLQAHSAQGGHKRPAQMPIHRFELISNIFCHVWLICLFYLSFQYMYLTLNSTNMCKQNTETRSFNLDHHFR